VLGLSNPSMVADRLDDDMKGVSLIDTPGGPQQMTVVNEIGLIAVIMRSDKPNAKEFQRAAFEYIKSMRRNDIAIGGIRSDTMTKALAHPDNAILFELLKTNARQLELAERTAEIERKVAAYGDLDNGYTTIVGYFNSIGGSVDEINASSIGKRASKLCRQRDIRIGTVKSVRWGSVQSYPESIVAEAYEWLCSHS
jgi:prophage antirepressor-like protein